MEKKLVRNLIGLAVSYKERGERKNREKEREREINKRTRRAYEMIRLLLEYNTSEQKVFRP